MALTKPELATQIQTTTVKFDDPIIEINAALAGANTDDLGIVMNRGTTGNNVGIFWDRSAQEFAFVTTTADGDSSGDLTFATYTDLKVNSLSTANFSLPSTDGTTGQVLTTDGLGAVTWEDAAGGAGGAWVDSGTDIYISTAGITDSYFATALTSATPVIHTMHGQGGLGTDITGASLEIAGGKGTGTGLGGDIVLQTALAGTTGATLNALTDRVWVTDEGYLSLYHKSKTGLSTASAWMNLGEQHYIGAKHSAGTFPWLDIMQNSYHDGASYKFIANQPALLMELYDGTLWLAGSAAGAADSTITWKTYFNIYNNGDSVAGSCIDTDAAMTANSSLKLVSQSAVRGYVSNNTHWDKTGDIINYDSGGTTNHVTIGVPTADTWTTTCVLNLGPWNSISARDNTGEITIGSNMYYDGSYRYVSNSSTARLTFDAGAMEFLNAANAAADTAITFTSRFGVDLDGNVSVGNAALATTATDGFLYIPTCAGAPTGTPTTKTGRVPLIFDTTNNNLYVYDGSWLSIGLA